MRILFLLVIAALATGQGVDSVAELSRRIKKDGDGVDPAVFVQLADHGTEAALVGLERGLGEVDDAGLRAALFGAIARFSRVPDLAARASGVLENEVRRGKKEASRLAAAYAILVFDPVELARGWAERHKDDAVKLLFADALVLDRAAQQDPEAVRAILEGSLSLEAGVHYLGIDRARAERLAETPHREVVRQALEGVSAPQARAVLVEAMGDRLLGRVWKLMLLRIFAGDSSPEVGHALSVACGDPDPAVALLAIDFVVARVDQEDRGAALRPLLRSGESSLRRAALAGLGVTDKGDAGFRESLISHASSKDRVSRVPSSTACSTCTSVPLTQNVASST